MHVKTVFFLYILCISFIMSCQITDNDAIYINQFSARLVREDLSREANDINRKYLEQEVLFIREVELDMLEVEKYIFPGDKITEIILEGTGQSGNVFKGDFPAFKIQEEPLSTKLVLVLTAPKILENGSVQTLMRLTHSPRTERLNYIQIPTIDGDVRLYLNSEGELSEKKNVYVEGENVFGKADVIDPGGKPLEYVTKEPQKLISGIPTYHLRVTDSRLGTMVVNAILVMAKHDN